MTRTEITEKAAAFSHLSRAVLARRWILARQKSGLQASDFEYQVHTFRNVTDGRCPDGCCGNEERAPWKPTPAEWVILAETTADRIASRKVRLPR